MNESCPKLMTQTMTGKSGVRQGAARRTVACDVQRVPQLQSWIFLTYLKVQIEFFGGMGGYKDIFYS